MKKFFITMAGALFSCLLFSAQTLPYQNPALSAHERAVDLCSRLTLEEKSQLMLDESPAIPRLGIKKFFWWSEALHGAANMDNVTVFPEPVAMAASFDPDLLYKVFDVASTEFRAQYNHRMLNGGEDEKFHSLSVWTPNVNIFRDPRWGRGQETYGEDPWLTSVMGIQVVRGLQGPEDAKYRKLWACAKHYAVHSGPEYTRHSANLTNVPVRDLWETYMPAFKTLVQDAKVREVMCAYQRLDDDPCCGSQRLLQQILRDEWGFKYLVVSDCGAVSDFYTSHKSSSDAVHGSAKAVIAGTDVECGYGYAYKSIPEAVRRGLLSEAEVDKHVIRLLEGRFDLGEMDDPSLVEWSKIPYSAMSTKESAALSLRMARETIVLLQNKNGVLPLQKGGERLAIIGPNADNAPMMWGNYNGMPNHTVTILDGIKAKQKKLFYAAGCDLTYDKVMECLMGSQCRADGRKGLKGTFWNNRKMEGKPVTTQYYTTPLAVTTAGMHNFAPGVQLEDFSAKYETIFTPEESGEYVVNVEGCGHFELFIDGVRQYRHHIWRTTPNRTAIQAEKGKSYQIEVLFSHVHTYNANLKINVAKEQPIDYDAQIAQLKGVDKVIFVGGISPALEGEEMPVHIDGFKGGDRTSIELPRVQRDFLRALKQAGKTVIFVNCSGSAIALTPEMETCDAIVQVWYPGQEGGTAVADVLFGDCNPSGKLPVTFYRDDSQLPDYEDYSMRGRTYRYFDDPLFAFGYGLSFTQFEIGEAQLTKTDDGKTMVLTVPVTNKGQRDGTETVQVYIRDMSDPDGPLKSLRGFARVDVKAGQTCNAEVVLDTDKAFEFWDASTNTMRSASGNKQYELYYGTSSRPADLKKMVVCPTAAALPSSPDSRLTVRDKGGVLSVCYDGRQVIELSSLGFEGTPVSSQIEFVARRVADYQMLAGKRLHCENEANEYRCGPLVLRLYNDGVAFRYEGLGKETTTYRIPEGTRRWMQQWTDSYEGFFPLTTASADGHWAYPALLEPADGLFALITEANIEQGQSASSLQSEGEQYRVVSDGCPLGHTPWRVVIVGSLADVVESTLVTDVSDACRLTDTSWIHPGVVSWVYWAYNHGSNDYTIIQKYVDLAATLHLPYVLIDAEWDEMRDGKTVEDAVAYAKSKGVKPLIWYNSSVGWVNGAPGPKYRLNKAEDREREFAWCERIGVAGVKIDFFSGDNQQNMDYCIGLLESAARHHLLVNFHGATIPRGWQRTWPNLLSTEGVYGAEWYNNVPTFTDRAARHNATLPFTRNVIGPMDYTPCAFSDSQHPHITTHAHELALTVLFESGLQHLADRPESFLSQPAEVRDFLSELPSVWDDTRLLSGYPGESVVMARRSGTTWYVAGINGRDEEQTLSIGASVLPKGQVTIFADGEPWQISTADSVPGSMKCRPRGGFVIVVRQ